jgi:hypothetical protein
VLYNLDALRSMPLRAPNVENAMKIGVSHEKLPIVFSLNVYLINHYGIDFRFKIQNEINTRATASEASTSPGVNTKK